MKGILIITLMNNMKKIVECFIVVFFLFAGTSYVGFSQTEIDTVYIKYLDATINTAKDSASYYRVRTISNGVLKAEDYSMKDSTIKCSGYYKKINPYIREGSFVYYASVLDGGIQLGRSEGCYINDKKVGLWKYYYSSGELFYTQPYIKGDKTGSMQGYYKTGEIKRIEKYKDGKFIEGNCYTLAGKDTAYYEVQIRAKFPGGDNTMSKYFLDRVIYPKEARKKLQEGKVYVMFTILENGTVNTAYVMKSSGYPLLDAAALEVVQNMPQFSPAYFDGVPVKMKMVQVIAFKLTN